MTDLHQSEEAGKVVDFLYWTLLGRTADAPGRKLHIDLLTSGELDAQSLAEAFVKSPEFQQRHGPDSATECEIVEIEGSKLFLPARWSAELKVAEGYEHWVLPYLLSLCKPGMTFLDIGASVGVYALPAASRVLPGGSVYAVEVSPTNAAFLGRSIEINALKNLHLLPLGVSSHLGYARLPKQISTNNNALVTDQRTGTQQLDWYQIVPVLPLDLLHPAIGKVDLIKMDIEGMEYQAAVGASNLLRTDRPIVFLEYSPKFQRQGSGVPGPRLLQFFIDLGYRFEILHRQGERELLGPDDPLPRIEAAWKRHVQVDRGTHLDLCLLPMG